MRAIAVWALELVPPEQKKSKLEELFRSADRRYNSGMFSGEDIIFDLVRPASGIALPFLIRMMACLMARS